MAPISGALATLYSDADVNGNITLSYTQNNSIPNSFFLIKGYKDNIEISSQTTTNLSFIPSTFM